MKVNKAPEQYISKFAVIAEIEKYISNYKGILNKVDKSSGDWVDSTLMLDSKIDVLQHLLYFLNTLEVKEETISNEPLISSELLTASADYAREQLANPDYPTYNDEYELLCAFKAGAEWQKKQTIDKACEWLEEHLLNFWSQRITNTDYFIEDFKQAMNK